MEDLHATSHCSSYRLLGRPACRLASPSEPDLRLDGDGVRTSGRARASSTATWTAAALHDTPTPTALQEDGRVSCEREARPAGLATKYTMTAVPGESELAAIIARAWCDREDSLARMQTDYIDLRY